MHELMLEAVSRSVSKNIFYEVFESTRMMHRVNFFLSLTH